MDELDALIDELNFDSADHAAALEFSAKYQVELEIVWLLLEYELIGRYMTPRGRVFELNDLGIDEAVAAMRVLRAWR